jgi:hypothetical protein
LIREYRRARCEIWAIKAWPGYTYIIFVNLMIYCNPEFYVFLIYILFIFEMGGLTVLPRLFWKTLIKPQVSMDFLFVLKIIAIKRVKFYPNSQLILKIMKIKIALIQIEDDKK